MTISIKEEVRNEANLATKALVLALSLLAGLVAMGLIFAASGKNPFDGLWRIFRSGFLRPYGITETIARAIPISLAALGLCVAFRGRFWNIGAEGQILAGASLTTWVGLSLGASGTPTLLVIAAMLLAGAAGGAIWGSIAALLRNGTGMNETISTLMLNYILAEFVKYLITGPWKGKSQHGFPYTDRLDERLNLATIPGTNISWLLLVLLAIAVVLCWFLIYRTKFGYELRVSGENQEAARYAGINAKRLTLLLMLISGGLAGLAGFGEIAVTHHYMTYPDTISAGYGFTAIIVARLAGLDPRKVPLAALFFAGIIVGGNAIQIAMGLPAATVQVFQGVILAFLILGDYFMQNRLVLSIKGARTRGAAACSDATDNTPKEARRG